MKIYLDNCCYSRPFDDQSQDRVHLESAAILTIVKRGRAGRDTVCGSTVLDLEMSKLKDIAKQEKIAILYSVAKETIFYSEEIQKRADDIQKSISIKSYDALHLASAECAGADYFLTTDDRLEKACARISLSVKVANPLKYITEVIENE